MIGIGKFPRKGCRLEDREMDGYAMLYRAYLARRDLPGPEPTFADFATIRKMQERIEGLSPEHLPPPYDSQVESDTRNARRAF
ncbi:MAG: hypothetical protein WB580_17560 [Candidatus Binataceae bacterium]